LLDRDARQHSAVESFIAAADEPILLSPFVLAELDYLVAQRFGVEVELALLQDVAEGAYELATIDVDDVARVAAVVTQYRDLGIGVADASIVVLAERLRTNRVLTLDERHFRALQVKGRAFAVLPADG
jgi:predicted nucleic acid-binding protein